MITHVLSEVSVVIQCCDNKTKTKEVHVKDLQSAVEEVDPRSSDDDESVIEKLISTNAATVSSFTRFSGEASATRPNTRGNLVTLCSSMQLICSLSTTRYSTFVPPTDPATPGHRKCEQTVFDFLN
jgi:hypothetical protein